MIYHRFLGGKKAGIYALYLQLLHEVGCAYVEAACPCSRAIGPGWAAADRPTILILCLDFGAMVKQLPYDNLQKLRGDKITGDVG